MKKKIQSKLNKKCQANFDKYLADYHLHTDFHNKVILKIHNEVYPRIGNLFLGGFYIEMVLLLNQVIELLVLKTIISYQFVISGSLILSKFDTILSIGRIEETSSKSTLGGLIFELDKYSANKPLISELKKYNKNVRIKFVHKLLDTKTSLDKMNSEAENIYKLASKLIDQLADLNQDVLDEEKARKDMATKILTDYPDELLSLKAELPV